MLSQTLALSAAVSLIAPDEPTRCSLEVDAAAVADQGAVIQVKLEEEGQSFLESNDIRPAREAQDAILKVVVQPDRGGESGYAASLVVERNGLEVADTRHEVDCAGCSTDELVAAVVDEFDSILPQLKPPEAEPVEAEGPIDNGGPIDTGVDRKGMGPMGSAGIAMGVLGLTGVVGGAVLVGMGQPVQEDEAQLRDFRTPGVAVLGGGGALLIAGAILIAVDRTQAKKRQTTVAPMMAPKMSGVSLRVRF